MDFIKKSFYTVSNAVEINKLKDKLEDLKKEKTKLEKKCLRIEQRNVLKENIDGLSKTHSDIFRILSLFGVNKENNSQPDEEDEEYMMFISLNNHLVESDKMIVEYIEYLKKSTDNKDFYLMKISETDKKIEDINQKLKSIREKQFGKKGKGT